MTPQTPLGGTQSAQQAIVRVRYTHDAMIDFIIANPAASQNAIATHFGYRVPSISRIFNSDAFRARLAERKAELIDPSIVEGFEDKMKALAEQSLEIVAENLATSRKTDDAFRALELTTKALGYGARQQNLNVQQNFVVALPQKAASSAEWAANHKPVPKDGDVQDAVVVSDVSPDLQRLLEKAA